MGGFFVFTGKIKGGDIIINVRKEVLLFQNFLILKYVRGRVIPIFPVIVFSADEFVIGSPAT